MEAMREKWSDGGAMTATFLAGFAGLVATQL